MIIPSRYTPLKKSFDGGMSTAALYCDRHLERNVIIKRLLPGADQKRIIDEIKALSSIRSDHVVEIYDVIREEDGSVAAIVEEFIDGEDLLAKAGKVSAAEALSIGGQLASGIEDVHRHGQIHRDIKLNNIKIDQEGCLKLFDFGLSRSSSSAATTGLVGTFGYIAPELCAPPNGRVTFTQSVDVYAFASVMLRLVRGKFPDDLKKVPPRLPCADANFHNQQTKLPAEVCSILNECHATHPLVRPSMTAVSEVFKRHILMSQHRATLVVGNNVYVLDAKNNSVNINAGVMGRCTVTYDGFSFAITAISGEIYVNNVPASLPTALPGSCVITMGPPSAGMNRVYVPVDVSHPESRA
jgi:serine/threonine-protein kinase